MNTLNRINRLEAHYGIIETQSSLPTGYLDKDNHFIRSNGSPMHDALDILDKTAGIDTRYKDGHIHAPSLDGGWGWCDGDHTEINYVGARVALHEQHLFNNAPPYFWLGAEAETIGATTEKGVGM